MVLDTKKQFAVILCNCGQPFQRERFKKHLQASSNKSQKGHGKEKGLHYCPKCNVWGNEHEIFAHGSCPRVSFPKADLRLILNRVEPPNREKLIETVAARKAQAEIKAAVATIEPKEKEWADLFGPPLSEDSSVEEPIAPKRSRVDLDSSVSSLSTAPSPNKTSTPLKHTSPPKQGVSTTSTTTKSAVHLPRQEAQHINITYEKNKLKGENERLKKTVASLNEEISVFKGKETLNKRLTERILELEASLKKEKEDRGEVKATLERERAEREKVEALLARERGERAEEVKSLHREFERQALKRKEEWEKQREEKDRILLHIELKGNRMARRHAESSPDASTCCYTNEDAQARCLHVEVSGYQTHTKVRNVRWPSGKLKVDKV